MQQFICSIIGVDIQVIAFDFGLERIGVATGNSELKISHPIGTISGKNKFDKLDKIAKLIEIWQPRLLLVGLPGGDTTNKQDLISAIKKFANRLRNKFNLPVEFVNEDYTSEIAATKLAEQSIHGYSQKAKLDELAASIILDRYFLKNDF